MAMGHRWTLSLLLLMLSRSARLNDDDRRVDRVVFGLKGQTVSFPVPEGNWGFVDCKWPPDLAYYTKVYLLGEIAARTGFALNDFGTEDEGRKYSIATDGALTNNRAATTHYRAVLVANTIEVDVGATLRITPETSEGITGITWKYTPTSITKATEFVDVLSHDTFMNRAHVDATTGKLSLSDWRWRDGGFFTAVINGREFAQNFKVVSIVRVTPGGDLILDPDLVARPNQLSWYRNDELVVELGEIGGAIYAFPHCLTANNCNLDMKTGKLTIKSWQKTSDGVFTMRINGQLQENGIKVVGDIIFLSLGQNMQLVPPSFDETLSSILWKNGGNLAAEYFAGDNTLSYWLICNNNNCILDKSTGVLIVKTWDPSNDNTFTVELNNWATPHQYVGVKKLDGYGAQVKTQRLNDRNTNLICAGDFDGAEPVKYFWKKSGTTDWVPGKKIMETRHVYVNGGRLGYEYNACKIKNHVSELTTNM